MSDDNKWTPTQVAMLEALYPAGNHSINDLAEALHKTPGAIRHKVRNLGLASLANANNEKDDLNRMQVRRGDRAFKTAMLAAIKGGAENPFIGVFRTKGKARYVPTVRAASDSGYRSSAGYTADCA